MIQLLILIEAEDNNNEGNFSIDTKLSKTLLEMLKKDNRY